MMADKPQLRISRSRIENLYRCRLCGYLEIKFDIKPPSIPFTLNIAVDGLLKKDFDEYRSKGEVPPVISALGQNLVPLQHPKIETWRDYKTGLERVHGPSGITLYGALDDVWKNEADEVLVVDYKATARAAPVRELGNASYHDGYRRQLDMYAWMLEGNDLKVAQKAYLFYVTARKNAAGFQGRLEFDPALVEHKIDTSWIEDFLVTARDVIDGGFPEASKDCEHCQYREAVNRVARS